MDRRARSALITDQKSSAYVVIIFQAFWCTVVFNGIGFVSYLIYEFARAGFLAIMLKFILPLFLVVFFILYAVVQNIRKHLPEIQDEQLKFIITYIVPLLVYVMFPMWFSLPVWWHAIFPFIITISMLFLFALLYYLIKPSVGDSLGETLGRLMIKTQKQQQSGQNQQHKIN